MATFAEAIASRGQRWSAIIRIEGLGASLTSGQLTTMGGDARACLCTTVPDYADQTIPVWKDYLAAFPDLLSERGSVWGGFPELGELVFSVLDYGDYLTEQLACDSRPASAINQELTATATEIRVKSSAGMTASSVVWVGSEAMHLIAVIDGASILVTRGYLGTTATTHATQTRIYTTINYLKRRRVDLYIVPTDATSITEEELVAQYVVDHGPAWRVSEDGSAVWEFAARSQSQYLARQAPQLMRKATVVDVAPEGATLSGSATVGPYIIDGWVQWLGDQMDLSASMYFRHEGGEVLTRRATGTVTNPTVGQFWGRRDILKSGKAEIKPGDVFTQVFVAEESPTGAGSFRFSFPAVTSQSSSPTSAWTKSAHPCDIMLNIMTSSADASDGLYMTNYESGKPNWSCLPSGFGIGIPAALIDFDSFLAVKQRTQSVRLPHFVYGHEAGRSFAELIHTNFLVPMGAFLTTDGGVVRIVLPSIPMAEEATTTLGVDNIRARPAGANRALPDMEISRGTYSDTTSITYELGATRTPLTVSVATFSESFGVMNTYALSDESKTIRVPGADASNAEFYGRVLAEPHLWRVHRPAYDVECSYDLSRYALAVGDSVDVTLDGMPNQAAAARGWSPLTCQLLRRGLVITDEGGAWIEALLMGYTQSQLISRITPSARVIGSSVSGPNTLLTVVTNEFTHTDAVNGLPTNDAAAFVQDDKVRIHLLDGTTSPTHTAIQTVVSVSGDVITVDGNLGDASSSAGGILNYADYDNAATHQLAPFAYFADLTTCTVGASSTEPYIFGRG